METTKYFFNDIVVGEEGLLKGPFGSDLKKELYVPKGKTTYKVYLQENILKQNNAVGEHYISKDYYEKSMKRYAVKEGDFIVTCDGTLGEIFQLKNITEPGIISSSLLRITLDKTKCDEKFFPYFFKAKMKVPLITQANNSVLKHLPGLTNIRNFSIDLPTLPVQKKIASVLAALDDKIALNQRINRNLEELARLIYDYWFVQFDFPDKNGKPYKTSGGKMVYNDQLKREIPAGWEVVDINKLCQVVDCLHSKKPNYCFEDERFYLLSLENITKDGYIDLSDKYYISQKDFEEWTSRICVKENDFLFTNAGRAGDMGMVPKGVKCAIGRNITSVRPIAINPWYLRCFFKSLYMREQILGNLDQGSFFMSFNVRSIKKLNILIPPPAILDIFLKKTESYLSEIENNLSEIAKLTTLRDRLLPLLMNGQVSVENLS